MSPIFIDRQTLRFGFSLVELLVVVAILCVLAVVALPATSAILQSMDISRAGQSIENQLDFARQKALANNRNVEVRFYRYSDPNLAGQKPGEYYRGLQSFMIPSVDPASTSNSTSSTPVANGKPTFMPQTVIIDSGSTLASLVNQPGRSEVSATSSDTSLLNLGTSYKYVYFQFKPDGSTDLVDLADQSLTNSQSSGIWFLTVHTIMLGDALTTPPRNYLTIQLDPYSGHVTEFRP